MPCCFAVAYSSLALHLRGSEFSMQIFLATALIFAGAMAAMAVGVIFSNRTLKGSCGGTGMDCTCSDEARRDCALAPEHGTD